jgi:squalene synthase HpnC
MAVDQHYEHFPVASLLVPSGMRPHVVAIYRFARFADDLADEGEASDQERVAALSALDHDLQEVFAGREGRHSVTRGLVSLRDANIAGVELQLFRDLISAFMQDITVKRYDSFESLLDYCRRSADPVGRLMLALAGVRDQRSMTRSDAICTALQLINFWQDAAIDASRGRIYVPQSDFARFGVSTADFPDAGGHQALMKFECDRTRALMQSGVPLLNQLRGRFKLEIAFTIAGGLRIIEKIAAQDHEVRTRPRLRWYDSPRMFILALRALRDAKRHP